MKKLLKETLLKKKYHSTQQNYLSFAEYIINQNFTNDLIMNKKYSLNGINKLIRLLALDTEHHIFSHLLKYKYHQEMPPFFTMIPQHCPRCNTELPHICPVPLSQTLSVDIAMNPVLSFPWDFNKLANSMSTIGHTINAPFSYRESNHFDNTIISPVNLLIIGNGFHSSFSGIYDSRAVLPINYTLDISPLYSDIYFDGLYYRHTKCNHILESPPNKSTGIIYEIGRLLIENNLNLLSLYEIN